MKIVDDRAVQVSLQIGPEVRYILVIYFRCRAKAVKYITVLRGVLLPFHKKHHIILECNFSLLFYTAFTVSQVT